MLFSNRVFQSRVPPGSHLQFQRAVETWRAASVMRSMDVIGWAEEMAGLLGSLVARGTILAKCLKGTASASAPVKPGWWCHLCGVMKETEYANICKVPVNRSHHHHKLSNTCLHFPPVCPLCFYSSTCDLEWPVSLCLFNLFSLNFLFRSPGSILCTHHTSLQWDLSD